MEDAPNLIKFASVHPYVTLPQPAQRYIPEWYKNLEHYINNFTVKGCMPFLDS